MKQPRGAWTGTFVRPGCNVPSPVMTALIVVPTDQAQRLAEIASSNQFLTSGPPVRCLHSLANSLVTVIIAEREEA